MSHDVTIPVLSAGAIFAKDFRVISLISQGGMGLVYLVEQLSTGNHRALKLMHREFVNDPRLRQRFEQEAKVASRIESEHVVQVVAAGIDEGSGMPWLAMELLKGQTLAQVIRQRGPLPPVEAWNIFSQLCHALKAAHAANVVHRDLKPENIFLAEAKREGGALIVKVLDFGIARIAAEARTTATAALGTPLWMAPEQAIPGSPIGPQADIWALGLLAFYILVGREYWQSPSSTSFNPVMAVNEVMHQPLVPASQRAAQWQASGQLPDRFDSWFDRCVNRDLRHRFSSVEELRTELFTVLRPWLSQSAERERQSVPGSAYPSAPPSIAKQVTQLAPHPLFPPPSHVPQTVLAPPSPNGLTPPGIPLHTPSVDHITQDPSNHHGMWGPRPTPLSHGNSTPTVTGMQAQSLQHPKPRKPSSWPAFVAMGGVAAAMLIGGGVGITKLRHGHQLDDCANEAAAANDRLESCRSVCDPTKDGAPCALYGNLLLQSPTKDNVKTAADLFHEMCSQGNFEACVREGFLHAFGPEEAPSNSKKAVDLFQQACDGRYMAGCTYLGVTSDLGWRPGGLKEAVPLYEKACDGGDPLGCVYLSGLHVWGRGVPAQESRAEELRHRATPAVEQGCKEGKADHCSALGYLFETSATPDTKAARDAYARACNSGDPLGCNNLGRIKAEGVGGPAEPSIAQELFEKACRANDPMGCNNAGAMRSGYKLVLRRGPRGAAIYKLRCSEALHRGCAGWGEPRTPWRDGPQDRKSAAIRFEEACKGGLLTSCVNLGGLLFIGQGIEKDRPRSHLLFNNACEKGDAGGCGESATLYSADYAERKSDPKKAYDLMSSACAGGEQDACAIVADYIASGFGTRADPGEGFRRLKSLCDEYRTPQSCAMLGSFYNMGLGVAKNVEEAKRLYEGSCEVEGAGCRELAWLHFLGDSGVTTDRERGRELFQKGCDLGDAESCADLGALYNEGAFHRKREHEQAAKLFEKGCAVGHAMSCSRLGRSYLYGHGVNKDEAKGYSLAREACDDGYPEACVIVGICLTRGTGISENKQAGIDILNEHCRRKTPKACEALKSQ
jgi:serine/threonine-protein kinase